jgi:hypothetical protein
MIRLRDILTETAHEDVVDLVRNNFVTVLGNYEEWLETQLDELVDVDDITPWNRYDTLMALRDNSDSPEEFIGYLKYRHKLFDTAQLYRFIEQYLDYSNIA